MFFERGRKTHVFEYKPVKQLSDHVVVIGAHRVGAPIVKYLQDSEIPFVVMDFNPSVVRELTEQNVDAVYGDISDPEIVDFLQVASAKLVICTASDLADNELLLNYVKEKNKTVKVVLRSTDVTHAKVLKQLGAEYVILPEKVSGDYIVSQLKQYWPDIHFKDIIVSKKSVNSLI